MGVKTILPLALVVGACGTEMVSMEPDNSNTNNTPSLDSSMPNVHDSGYKAPDAGVPTPLDAGYAPDAKRPTATGIRIYPEGSEEGCLEAYTPFNFSIITY